ncbi:endochitinase A-like [Miscanthus floridulus]|uniref:endochitinase A-like n=1 Tax=Miscanthus floridulus TaxID=154761 RepID=UPI00345976F5
MELNSSTSPAAGTSPAEVLEHGEPSVRDPSLLSPAFSPAPSPGLVPASASGSGSSWYEQIPPSPAVGVGNGSLSVHAHATSSSQSVPSSSFPTASTLPMVGYDLFGNPEAMAATPLPTLLGSPWDQGQSSSMAASVLPECPSPGLFGFDGESAVWPNEEMSSSFFSPPSAGGLAPQSSDNLVGCAQPSSDSKMEPLPQSLRIPSVAVEGSPVDAPLPPIEKEEKMDVSAFLVSDPEDQLPNASWMATSPQMGGGGGGASASWMAPGSTCNNWTPMLAPTAASTCTMVSTSSGSMAYHSGGSSIGVTSSIGGMMKPSSPVLPLVPPSPQAAGSSSTNFNGFAQPSSSSILAPTCAKSTRASAAGEAGGHGDSTPSS